MKKPLFILWTVCLLCVTRTAISQYTWNAYNDFYFDSTNYANHSTEAAIPWPTAPTPAIGTVWGYYDCNVNGNGFPVSIGEYFGPGNNTAANEVLYSMAIYQPLGVGQNQLGGGVPGNSDAWDATGGSGFARYGDNQGWGTQVGEYGGAWYSGAPGYGTTNASTPGLYLTPAYLGNGSADGIGNVVTWTAPCDGTYTFSGYFLIANNNPGNDYAVIDSQGGIEVPKTTGISGSYNAFSFEKTFTAGDVVEFQVGSGGQSPANVGFNCTVDLVQITDWNAYNDFYFDSTNFANHDPSIFIPWPAVPSATSMAWGYYDCNINGDGGYPASIGIYFPPGGTVSANEVLYSMANYQPLGPGEAQLAGGVPGSGDAWDATGGSGFARYSDDNGWGTVIGEYGGAWYPGAPGYGTTNATATGLYLAPSYLGNPGAEGIGNVVTWSAPSDGTYTFTGDFLVASNNPGFDYAIVDSDGGTEVPRTVAGEGSYNTFSFQKTLKARDVIEFQVGSDIQAPANIGFNCSVHLVKINDWNAYNDFYFDTPTYQNNSPGTQPLFPPYPSITGGAWGYYDANCNWSGGYPGSIGAYFGPGSDTALDEVLQALDTYQPLGPGQGQVGGGTVAGPNGQMDQWDATGGSGFARYDDTNGWGTGLGEYGQAWFAAAPGYGTSYGNVPGIWMQAGWLGGNSSQGEGICPVVTWTAPMSATYNFSGSFLIGNNGTTGPDGPNCDYAIVDSLGGLEVPKTVVPQGSYNTFSFTKTFNAGDVVEFQIGTDFQVGAAVGFNCNISTNPIPAELVSASRPESNASEIILTFAAPLYGPSVTNVANYSINGVTVTSAQLTGSESNEVVLTISPGVNYPTTITVNGVEGSFGQLPVAANTMASISVPLYVPDDIGSATNAAQDTFSGNTLNPNWQSGLANYDSGNANYYNSLFVQSNGVLHCSCDTNWDLNYLVYVDPSYQGQVQEALMHFTITAANFDTYAVAGVGACVQPNPWGPPLQGGDCLRTVTAGYADDGVDYPFFLACSDDAADNTGNGDSYNLQWNVGGSYWLRIRQDIDTNPATDGTPGGIISTKAWAGDGSEPEPTNWQSVWKDPNGGVTRSGYAAIRAGYGVGAIMNFNVDYFLVKAAGLPTITPTLPFSLVPAIDLGIAANGNEAILNWPAAVAGAFQLQSAASLTSGWSNVTTPVVVSGVQNTVIVPLNGQQNFFRLVQQ